MKVLSLSSSLKRKLFATAIFTLLLGALTAGPGAAALPMCQVRCNNQYSTCWHGCGAPHNNTNPCFVACGDALSACLDVCLR